jgi:hypothetical protein
MYVVPPELRACMIAARAGDHDAARQILKLYRHEEIAREIRKGRPFSNRVRRAVDCLCAGAGSDIWEVPLPDGRYENLLAWEPPPPDTPAQTKHHFDEE